MPTPSLTGRVGGRVVERPLRIAIRARAEERHGVRTTLRALLEITRPSLVAAPAGAGALDVGLHIACLAAHGWHGVNLSLLRDIAQRGVPLPGGAAPAEALTLLQGDALDQLERLIPEILDEVDATVEADAPEQSLFIRARGMTVSAVLHDRPAGVGWTMDGRESRAAAARDEIRAGLRRLDAASARMTPATQALAILAASLPAEFHLDDIPRIGALCALASLAAAPRRKRSLGYAMQVLTLAREHIAILRGGGVFAENRGWAPDRLTTGHDPEWRRLVAVARTNARIGGPRLAEEGPRLLEALRGLDAPEANLAIAALAGWRPGEDAAGILLAPSAHQLIAARRTAERLVAPLIPAPRAPHRKTASPA